MTSKNFFWKQCKADAKRQWPLYLISFGIHLVTLVLAVFMLCYRWKTESVQQLTAGFRQDYIFDIRQLISGGNIAIPAVAMLLGFAFALQAFAWVNKSSQIDFYYSIPVRKSDRFWSLVLTNGVGYLSGLFACQVVVQIIIGVNGFWTPNMLGYAAFGTLAAMLIFEATFGVTLIGVMLTGSGLLAFLGGGFLLAMEPIAHFLGRGYVELFFNSVYSGGSGGNHIPFLLTPFAGLWKMYRLSGYDGGKLLWQVPLIMLIQTVVYLAIAYLLYKKRPALNGEKQMIFAVSKPVIKVLILVIGGLALGWIVAETQYETPEVGLWGIVVGVVAMQVLVQSLMDGNVRHFAKGWQSFLVAGALSVCIFCFFAYDWSGYDSMIPETEKIDYVGVDIENNFGNGFIEEAGTFYYGDMDTIETTRFQDERTIEKIRQVLEGAKENNSNHKISQDGYTTDQMLDRLNVKYQLKNGRTIYRSYLLTYGELYQLECIFVENPEYRKSNMNFSAKAIEKTNDKLALYYKDSTAQDILLSNSAGRVMEIIKMAEKDYLNRDGRMEVSQPPIGQLKLQMYEEDSGVYSMIYIPVYAKDDNVMSYLHEKDLVSETAIREENVLRISVDSNITGKHMDWNREDEMMQELLPQLILQFDCESNVRRYGYVETDYEVYLYDTDGNSVSVGILKGGKPKDFDSYFGVSVAE